MDTTEDVVCIAKRIVKCGPIKHICFEACGEGRITRQLVAGGHELALKMWELRVSDGEQIWLWYPFWKAIHVGDRKMLSVIALHPFAPSARVH